MNTTTQQEQQQQQRPSTQATNRVVHPIGQQQPAALVAHLSPRQLASMATPSTHGHPTATLSTYPNTLSTATKRLLFTPGTATLSSHNNAQGVAKSKLQNNLKKNFCSRCCLRIDLNPTSRCSATGEYHQDQRAQIEETGTVRPSSVYHVLERRRQALRKIGQLVYDSVGDSEAKERNKIEAEGLGTMERWYAQDHQPVMTKWKVPLVRLEKTESLLRERMAATQAAGFNRLLATMAHEEQIIELTIASSNRTALLHQWKEEKEEERRKEEKETRELGYVYNLSKEAQEYREWQRRRFREGDQTERRIESKESEIKRLVIRRAELQNELQAVQEKQQEPEFLDSEELDEEVNALTLALIDLEARLCTHQLALLQMRTQVAVNELVWVEEDKRVAIAKAEENALYSLSHIYGVEIAPYLELMQAQEEGRRRELQFQLDMQTLRDREHFHRTIHFTDEVDEWIGTPNTIRDSNI